MQVQVSGDAWVPDAGMTAPAKPVGPNAAECIPWLSALGAKAAPKRTSQASLAAAAAASQGPHAARAGVPAQRAQQGAAAAAPAACAATPAKERPAPQADAGQPGRGGQSMVTDSAGSMNGRGRTLRRTCDPAEVVLTPTKKLCLNASVDKACALHPTCHTAGINSLRPGTSGARNLIPGMRKVWHLIEVSLQDETGGMQAPKGGQCGTYIAGGGC